MRDLIIIGSGPAGLSAALTAKKRNLDFTWFGNANLSLKIERAEKISNFPGLIAVSGKEMQEMFLKQMQHEGIKLTEKRINTIYNMGDYFVGCVNEEMYESKTVLLAVGMESTKGIPGEERLLGKGVSYCATCDGALYRGRKIAVVCTNPQFEEEIEYLADMASEVEVFTTYKDCSVNKENVRVRQGYPTEIIGENRVEAIAFNSERLSIDGVFCLKDSVSPAVLLSGLEMKDNHIVVDRQQRTNIPGCFAAGDCTGRPYQYTKAVGEGNVALHSILDYIKEGK